jgi:hypothetical protein
MIDINTDEHVLVSHARFRACRERRLRVVTELRSRAGDHASAAQVLVGVVETDEPEHREACLPVRGLRLVSHSVPVQDAVAADGRRPYRGGAP